MLARRRHRVELVVFLLLLVPEIALAALTNGTAEPFPITAIAGIVHDIALTALVLYFVWSDGEPLLGWTTRRIGREVALGVALYIPMFVLLELLELALARLGIRETSASTAFLMPHSLPQIGLAFALVIVVAIAEESIFRGYLLLRLREVTGSTVAAVALATIVFAAGHTYSGAAGVIGVAFIGIVLSVVYLWRRSLVAAAVMHLLQDGIALVVIPLLHIARGHG